MSEKLTPLHFKFYHSLQYLPLGRSFGTKLFFVAFIAIHVPLISLLVFLVIQNGFNISASITVLTVTLIATLVSTISTLFVFHAALSPLRIAASELNQYLDKRKMPNLPIHYNDDVGDLMGNIQRVVSQLEFNLRRQETLASTDSLTETLNRRAFFYRRSKHFIVATISLLENQSAHFGHRSL